MRNQLKSDPTVKCRHVSVSITDLTTAPWGLKFCLWKCASSLTWREFTGERLRFSWCCFFCSGSFSWRAARRLPAEDGHHNIFRNQRASEWGSERERDSIHFWLVRLNKLQFVSHLESDRLAQPFAPETCELFVLENGVLLNGARRRERASAGWPAAAHNAETPLMTGTPTITWSWGYFMRGG